MRALIAHRRLVTDTDGTQKYELAIGERTFACFNGFNREDAFHKQNDPAMVSLVTDLDGRFNNRIQDWLTTVNQRSNWLRGKTHGQWECLAIGWMYNNAAANANGPMHGRALPGTAFAYDYVIGNALRREGFMGRYYDAWNGGYISSRRALTPNETFLTRVFTQFEREDRASVPIEVQQASAFAAAVNHNQSSAGCLYQFVGSERPSGQAVAFLQTFRNISEVQYTGWTGANQMKRNLIIAAWNRIDRNGSESIIPLMDHLVNYGTDNAITCYAGAGVILHGIKYGFWSLAEFFHNTASMITEGRYNKGAQSTNLSNKYATAARRNNLVFGSDATHLLTSLKSAVTQQPINVEQYVSYDYITRNATSPQSLQRLIETVTSHIRNIASNDPTPQINRLIDMARAIGDARTPVAPPAPPPPRAPVAPTAPAVAPQGAAQSATPRNTTAGAAVGFTQWTSTAVH